MAKMAMDAEMSSGDIREAAEAAPYIFNTCRPTVPPGTPSHLADDEIGSEDELEDDMKSVIRLFEGAIVVKEIPYALDAGGIRLIKRRSTMSGCGTSASGCYTVCRSLQKHTRLCAKRRDAHRPSGGR